MISLRPYQQAALDRVLELIALGVRRILVVAPTGSGKTVIGSALIAHYVAERRRVCFLAHRREIIKQTVAKLARFGVPIGELGVMMAGTPSTLSTVQPPIEELSDDELWRVYGRRAPRALVQVGSIDTFRHRVRPEAQLVIVDEAHRALAKSYRDVQADYPSPTVHVGLTATPVRADGQGLKEAYDEIVVVASYMDLVELGSLVEPICYGVPPTKRADLRGVRKSGGDYNAEQLAQAVDRGELVGDIVEHWRELGRDAPTFCFAVSVEHSKHIRDRFIAAGIPAAHVDGNTDVDERERALAGLRDGSVRVLCNCNVFTEGTDVPEVKTIILARPTLSLSLYLQMGGRGGRPCGEHPFVLLDHAGCIEQHGLLQEHREWTLEGRPKRGSRGAAGESTKQCPSCWAYVPPQQRVCPGCGHTWSETDSAAKPPSERDGKLVKLNAPKGAEAELTPAQRKRLIAWDEMVARWREENAEREARGDIPYAPGWVVRQWRHETGHQWPPKGSRMPTLTPEQVALREAHEQRSRQERRRRPDPPPTSELVATSAALVEVLSAGGDSGVRLMRYEI